ncbi:MAG TPA: DUF1801 domain-containing protein [Cytophagaceae bacterium]|jgi:uncharacterized protein YdhG (YjbR/CyaY superfamily)
MKTDSSGIDEYIKGFPREVQLLLEQLRAEIKRCAPEAKEIINYGIPTFALHGNLVHFAAYKNHIGFYPAPSAIRKFKEDLSIYKSSKGAVQFPLDKRLPLSLIAEILKFRLAENLEKAQLKKSL